MLVLRVIFLPVFYYFCMTQEVADKAYLQFIFETLYRISLMSWNAYMLGYPQQLRKSRIDSFAIYNINWPQRSI